MTALRFRDGLTRLAWLRGLLACAVAVLALAVSLHHSGWMPDMQHGSMSAPAGVHSPTNAAMPMASHADHAVTGTDAPTQVPGDGHHHAMTMATCLAILGSALLLPAIIWIRRSVARRRLSTRRRPRLLQRPPLALTPALWLPPPRGGPSPQSLLCVVRR